MWKQRLFSSTKLRTVKQSSYSFYKNTRSFTHSFSYMGKTIMASKREIFTYQITD